MPGDGVVASAKYHATSGTAVEIDNIRLHNRCKAWRRKQRGEDKCRAQSNTEIRHRDLQTRAETRQILRRLRVREWLGFPCRATSRAILELAFIDRCAASAVAVA